MNKGASARWFALAAVCVVASTLIAAAVMAPGARAPRNEPRSAPRERLTDPPTTTPAETATHDGGPRIGGPRRALQEDRSRPARRALVRRSAHRSALRDARRFLRALLRFELGDSGPDPERALRRGATRHLAELILRAPPRTVASVGAPPPGRIVALETVVGARHDRLEIVATVARGRARTGLVAALRRRGSRWIMTALR